MTHERYKELLALRLYDELNGDETGELDTHLEGCDGCRAYERELAGGLGSTMPPAAADLPEGWSDALRALVHDTPAPATPLRPWLVAAGSFAAGVALTLAIARGDGPSRETPHEQSTEVAPTTPFERSAPPTPAASSGRFTLLSRSR